MTSLWCEKVTFRSIFELESGLKTNIRLAVFDCDGTLVDSQHMINSCMIDAFESVKLAPPPLSEVRRIVGLPLAGAIRVLCGNDEAAPVDEMVKAYSNSWQSMRLKGDLSEPLYEGIPALLEALRDDGWTLGVATGKSMRGLEATLAHHDLASHFVTLQTADKARVNQTRKCYILRWAKQGLMQKTRS